MSSAPRNVGRLRDGKEPGSESLPRMVLMTYQMSDQIREIASAGEFDEFDLNEFFAAKGEGDVAEFKHRDEGTRNGLTCCVAGSPRPRWICSRVGAKEARPCRTPIPG